MSESCYGRMAEWLNAAVLKTVEGNTSRGSNPFPSAIFENYIERYFGKAHTAIYTINFIITDGAKT